MTNQELKNRIEANQQKLAKANSFIEKLEKKIASYIETARNKGIDLDTVTPQEIFEKLGETEGHKFYWDIFCNYRDKKEQLRNNRFKVEDIHRIISELESKLNKKRSDSELVANLPKVILDFCDEWCRKATEFYLAHHDNSRNDQFRYRTEYDIRKFIKSEAQSKAIEIAHRVKNKCGTITDASGLYIGENGTINGQIIGDKGNATVETIYAGGYNIQCLHFRVLVK